MDSTGNQFSEQKVYRSIQEKMVSLVVWPQYLEAEEHLFNLGVLYSSLLLDSRLNLYS